jgi:phytoene dehydrogenase-like protein
VSTHEYDAIVVGSGPNGLAAAIVLAHAGRRVLVREAADSVGGGLRSAELTLPGFVHDVCAAVHPLAASSPLFRSLPLAANGLEWVHPPSPLAHPFDDGPAAVLERSLADTANGLGRADGNAWRRLLEPFVNAWPELAADVLAPLRIPRHPIRMARFGLRAIRSAAGLARQFFEGDRAQVLIVGNAAHSMVPLDHSPTAAFGLTLVCAGHAVGWPIARGGSQRLADALAGHFRALGGEVATGAPVDRIEDVEATPTVLFDVTPRQFLRIAGHRLTTRYRRALERFQYGSGAFKVDWALAGPIPWRDPACARAGTVHLVGTMTELLGAEHAAYRGELPEKPFVLLGQPTLVDPSRAPTGRHIAWAYCHVPNGSTVDMTSRIEAQVERFAPGFRDLIIDRHVASPAVLEQHNPNLVGGDISAGLMSLRQLFLRPAARLNPYTTPLQGVYLCSASTPPGGAVHGMCGYYAARSALGLSLTPPPHIDEPVAAQPVGA